MMIQSERGKSFNVFYWLLLAGVCHSTSWAQTPASSEPPLETLIPADKKLDPAWVNSLTERGEPHVCTGAELKYLGLPIGGLFSGQMYIGGNGQLWKWDVFNDQYFTGWSGNYRPELVTKPLEQSFSLTIDGKETPLDVTAFPGLTFRGEYPMAFIDYKDPKQPVEVHLTAFSPFIPLNVDDSSLPLTVLEYSVKNTSDHPLTVGLKGALENFVLNRERGALNCTRVNKISSEGDLSILSESMTPEATPPKTEDHVLEDWSKPDFSAWKIEGTAFGSSPLHVKGLTPDQKKLGLDGLGASTDGFISSMPAVSQGQGQTPATKLTSAPFTIDRSHLYFWIKLYGNHHEHCGLNLLVDGKVVASYQPYPFHVTTRGLALAAIDVRPYAGKQGTLQIVYDGKDQSSGITVGSIFLSDKQRLFNPLTGKEESFPDAEDNGSMGIALLDGPGNISSGDQQVPGPEKLVGTFGRSLTLKPGESQNLTFLVAWYFPNLNHIPSVVEQGRWYGSKFHSMSDVIHYFVQNRERLVSETQLWHDTWYDSTLPYWFLDRTMIPTDNLASSTNYRFKNGRWWAWEGVGACEGTCGHVYGYAQAVARLFPEIERDQRERIDFGTSLSPEGWIACRGDNKGGPAIDAQGFYILRALREHQMTTNNAFLKSVWPGVKKAMGYMMSQDPGQKGVIEGAQHNTLDADWYGEVSWYNGIYLAALRATAQMADIMGEPDYAAHCRTIAEAGEAYMAKNLFNGEYFQNKVDPAHLNAINSGSGCEIDQVLGQSWAFQVGLPRVLPQKETLSSMGSIWKYNFAPDVGPYRAAYKGGRTYAIAGESGVFMCTFPCPDWDFNKANGEGSKMFAAYFNECMTGFEHQLAGHMIWEGMVTEGLAIERAINDRYAPAKRNSYNEVECGDHYGRAMAAYGVYLAACGFQYDGPTGSIGFAPRIHPEHFMCAFTSAEGWGSYSQDMKDGGMTAQLAPKYGQLSVQTIHLDTGANHSSSVKVMLDGKEIPATLSSSDSKVTITLTSRAVIAKGETLSITLQ